MTDDVRVLKKATCTSLSGRSELTYEFGYNDEAKSIVFRIADSSGNGHFHDGWIHLDAILVLLETAKEPFSLSVFKSLYPGQSINNVGFLGAVLQKEGMIVNEKRQYLKKGTKAFLADLNKLIKLKRPAKKTAKTEQKEEPAC